MHWAAQTAPSPPAGTGRLHRRPPPGTDRRCSPIPGPHVPAPGEDAAGRRVPGLQRPPAPHPARHRERVSPPAARGGGGVPRSLRTGVNKRGPACSATAPPPARGGQRWPELSAGGGHSAALFTEGGTGLLDRPPHRKRGGKAAASAARRPPHPRTGWPPAPTSAPAPGNGRIAPLTSARRPPPLRLLRSAAAKPNNIPYSGSGVSSAPARRGGRGLQWPLLRGAQREM